MLPTDRIRQLEEDAARFRRYGAEDLARALEAVATDLASDLEELQSETVDLATASLEGGYSVDHLARMIRDGAIANAGRKGAPRIRRGDIPVKAGYRRPAPARAHGARSITSASSPGARARRAARSTLAGG